VLVFVVIGFGGGAGTDHTAGHDPEMFRRKFWLSLVLTVPAYAWLWSRHDTDWHHYRRYTRPRWRGRYGCRGC
jgi:hypothetical protein